jgi:hypothetical protein
MPLADLFLATDATAPEVGVDIAAPDPSDPDPRCIDIKGYDVVPLLPLWCLLRKEQLNIDLLSEFPVVFEGGPDGPWIYRLPDQLVRLLAGLSPSDAQDVGADWGSTEEIRDLEARLPGVTLETLTRMVDIAKRATSAQEQLYLRQAL